MMKANLKLYTVVYSAKGDTLEELVSNLTPKTWKGVGVLTIVDGERTWEKIIGRPLMAKLFGPMGRVSKELGMRQLKMMYGVS